MSIKNEPKIKNPLIVGIREQLDLPATIAKGDAMCKIRFVRRKK